MTTPREILVAARKRIEDRDRWTQGTLARDSFGRVTDRDDPSACKWCLVGAVSCEGVPGSRELSDAYTILERALPGKFVGIAQFNDHEDTIHVDILELLDEAIQEAP